MRNDAHNAKNLVPERLGPPGVGQRIAPVPSPPTPVNRLDRSTFSPQIPQAYPRTGGGRFSAISDGRSPGKTPSLGGDSRERKSRATKNTKMHEKLFWRFPYWWQRPLVAAAPAIPAPWRSWRAWRGTISRKGRKAREGESWAQPFLWLFASNFSAKGY